jgi:hypothetical protein
MRDILGKGDSKGAVVKSKIIEFCAEDGDVGYSNVGCIQVIDSGAAEFILLLVYKVLTI